MKSVFHIAFISSLIGLTACSEPPQPRSVTAFMENSNLLEAALVRCMQDRAQSRYDAECINAREAVRLGEAESAKDRRAALEAESKRKRDALRRTQWAAAEARRRAVEAVRRREEADYLAQFGELPQADIAADEGMSGNAPLAIVPAAKVTESASLDQTMALPTSGSSVPTREVQLELELETETEITEETSQQGSDLEAIREELRRRNDDGENQ